MKNITIAGRLTKDAETRDAGSSRVTSFSVAVDHWDGREKSAAFFDCSWWGARGEKVAQYLTKGASVTASGDLATREHNGKTYLTVRVENVTLQGGGKARDEHDQRQPAERETGGYDLDDAVPF